MKAYQSIFLVILFTATQGYAESNKIYEENRDNYRTYEDCVENEKITIKLKYDIPLDKAYRKAILYCNKLFDVNSTEYYRDSYKELDSRIKQ